MKTSKTTFWKQNPFFCFPLGHIKDGNRKHNFNKLGGKAGKSFNNGYIETFY
jgi:hypothetical protein